MATSPAAQSAASRPDKSPAMTSRERRLVAALAVVVVAAAAYWPVLFHDFVSFDDNLHIYENPYFAPVTLAHIAYFWRRQFGDLYIPVSYTVFGALAWIASETKADPSITDTGALFDPRIFHAASFAFHIASTLLVFALLNRLVKDEKASAFGAALFAIHPFQVESVAWISEIRGMLSNLFSLAALVVYAIGLDRSAQSGRPRLSWAASAALVALTLLATLSKPSAVILPLLMAIVAVSLKRRPAPDALIDAAPVLIAALPVVAITRMVQHAAQYSIAPFYARPLIAGDALAFYVAKLIAPARMTVDYGRTPSLVLHSWWGYVTWLVPAALAAIAYRQRRRAPYLGAGMALAAAALLPVLGFSPFKFQAFSTVADRYMYLAMLGPAVIAAYALASARSAAIYAAAAAALAVLFAISFVQLGKWQNSEILYSYTLAVNPASPPIQVNYADLYMKKDPAVAEAHFRAAIRSDPRYPDAHMNLGTVLENTGRPAQALAEFAIANRESPADARIPYDMGNALMEMGKYDAAAKAYSDALRLDPAHLSAVNNQGQAYLQMGDYGAAVQCFLRAASLRPADPRFRINAAIAMIKAGRLGDAAQEASSVLQADPANAQARAVLSEAQSALRRPPASLSR